MRVKRVDGQWAISRMQRVKTYEGHNYNSQLTIHKSQIINHKINETLYFSRSKLETS